jgi:hypothetical protein
MSAGGKPYWQCTWGGCEDPRAPGKKHCPRHVLAAATATANRAERSSGAGASLAQPDLFSAPLVPHAPAAPAAKGSAESKAGAARLEGSGRAARHRRVFLRWISAAGDQGLTGAELTQRSGLADNRVRPRLWELTGNLDANGEQAPLVVRNGPTRETGQGGTARAFVATELGHRMAALAAEWHPGELSSLPEPPRAPCAAPAPAP